MKVRDVGLADVWLVQIDKIEDARGFFARTWCDEEFVGLTSSAAPSAGTVDAPRFVQSSLSFNLRKGTLRGMHYQAAPSREGKLVRCCAGAIFDVVIDLRPGSETYLKWASVELTQGNRDSLYIPTGFAHGFQTLTDNAEVLYQMTDVFRPDLARGLRWNDPLFAIRWPEDERLIHPRDAQYADYIPNSES